MKATCWMGPNNMQVREVPDPKILNQRDCIVKITSTAICGSDLHLYNGFLPLMEPGEKIAWRSTEKADVPNAGTVRFVPAPDGESTEVHVVLVYDIPGGAIGKAVAKYFGEEPHQQLDDDLRRLKQVLETGEVVRSDGAPWGKRARKEFPQRPAQPLSDAELANGADA